ncbi:MAG: hypothetical protein ABI446_04165 [Gemmatimonadaceae bacterium]
MQASSSAFNDRGVIAAVVSFVVTVIVVAGCSGSGDSTSPPPGGNGDPVWADVASRTWSMSAGNEGYKCSGAQVSADEYLTGRRFASPSPAQEEVMLFVTDVAPTLGNFDCNSGAVAGQLIYAGSIGTTAIEFSGGKGVHIAAGKYLLLNIHLNNTEPFAIDDSTRVEGRVGKASDVTTPMEMILAGTRNFSIPADNVTHTISGHCFAASDQHFVAVLPLMRSHAIHQSVTLMAPSDSVEHAFYDAAFNLGHVLYTPLSVDLSVSAGARLVVTCSYVNGTGAVLSYGEMSSNETCYSGIYRYPVVAGAEPFACSVGSSFDVVHGES